MELINGGQLKSLFKRKNEAKQPRPLTDLEASRIMKSILQGVAYIHDMSFIHRDIKPENILLVSSAETCFDVKIIDFGLSAEFNLFQGKEVTQKAGTLIYMAPE
jgi:serine/threonine protein kinase